MSSEAGELSSGNRSSEEPETVCVVRWMDGDAWEEMAVPAYTDIQGAYPEQEQEIMLSLRSLKALGIDRPEQGMQIDLKVFIGLFRTETETFRLSGWFTDYSEDTEEVSPGYISGRSWRTGDSMWMRRRISFSGSLTGWTGVRRKSGCTRTCP